MRSLAFINARKSVVLLCDLYLLASNLRAKGGKRGEIHSPVAGSARCWIGAKRFRQSRLARVRICNCAWQTHIGKVVLENIGNSELE